MDFFSKEILNGKLHFLCSEIFGKSIKNQAKLGTIKNSYIYLREKCKIREIFVKCPF